jgi:uncharacterized protein (TIGR00369 family)
MHQRIGYKPLLNLENHKCFGCSPINPSGLQMKFYAKDESVYSWVTVSEHLCGWENLVHGGVITTILDEIMSRTALYILKKFIMTKEIHIRFLKPVLIETELMARGSVVQVNHDREARMEGLLFNEKKQLCAQATGSFALFSPSSLKKKTVIDHSRIDDLARLING